MRPRDWILCPIFTSKRVVTISLTPGALNVLGLSCLHSVAERTGTGMGRNKVVMEACGETMDHRSGGDVGCLRTPAADGWFSVRPLAALGQHRSLDPVTLPGSQA